MRVQPSGIGSPMSAMSTFTWPAGTGALRKSSLRTVLETETHAARTTARRASGDAVLMSGLWDRMRP